MAGENVIHFHLTTDLMERGDLLDRRDEIVDLLKVQGIRVSYTDAGANVYLSDKGVPTLAEAVHQKLDINLLDLPEGMTLL